MAISQAALERTVRLGHRRNHDFGMRRRPRTVVHLLDLLVVLLLFTYNLPMIAIYSRDGAGPLVVALLFSLGACTPYLLRQTFPVTVFVAIYSMAWIQVLWGIDIFAANLMLAFALYNLATRRTWIVTSIATACVVGWFVIGTAPVLQQGYTSIGDLGIIALALIWAATWGTLVRFRRQYIQSLKQRAAELEKEKVAQTRAAAAEERTRIAREIHDIVAHSLGAMVVMSDAAASRTHADPDLAKTTMYRVRDSGRAALAEMRSVLSVLRSDGNDTRAPQPGIAQLSDLVDQSRAAGLKVDFRVSRTPPDLSESIQLCIYRLVQEALTNTRKHAGGDDLSASVDIEFAPNCATVTVKDNGIDANRDSRSAKEASGHGLVGMRERVSAFGGTLAAGPDTAGGFEVRARLPIGGTVQ